jgi:hypothetical protein
MRYAVTTVLVFTAAICVPIALGIFLVDLVLLRRHRRRTGRELVEPVAPYPGMAAQIAGLDALAPRLSRRIFLGYKTTIDLAPRGWRRLTVISTIALWVGLLAMLLAWLIMPEMSSSS